MKKKAGKKKRVYKSPKKLRFSIFLYLGVLAIFLVSAVTLFNNQQTSKIASDEKNALQIGTFNLTPTPIPPTPTAPVVIPPTATPIVFIPTPTPTIFIPIPTPTGLPYCPPDASTHDLCQCIPYENSYHKCSIYTVTSPPIDCNSDADCQAAGKGVCNHICLGKPVIYLYPEEDTLVDVSVKTEGKVVVSDPLYPSLGWQNVLAHPNGQLEYQGKTYRELFYESESSTLNTPKKGIIIKRNELEPKLKEYITLLGLTRGNEQQEFLDWWIPRLQALHAPFIFFSVLEPSEKVRLDQVSINPKPDTFIQFIAYFKPLSKIEPIEQLEINPAPKRAGFTAVEWGGVIDR